MKTKSLNDKVRSWDSFCTEYTYQKPRGLREIHKYIDACSGPAILKLISVATARNKVTLVHPAFLSTPAARKKLKFVHPAFDSESNTRHINVDGTDIDDIFMDEFDIRDLGIEKLGIDDITMDGLDIRDFDISDYEYTYLIDLDRSTLKVYEDTDETVCEYTFAELESFSEDQFIRRYCEEVNDEEDLDSIPKYRLMLAGSIYPDTHKEKASKLAGKFEFCSKFRQHPTYLVCTRREYRKRKPMKKIKEAKENRTPICDYESLDKKKLTLLWHPKDSKS
ncbi:hypothetical protein FMUND_317 [Fusarium mundagurra]|uniref:Uncharacterized protein n=1 Tax=Fusarium mundagurra TaxID=1567541 RepID=A0A8H5Z8V3_9HYPO|nr:hypothetical protein FMUND_317 [Fusarium mundagurra]